MKKTTSICLFTGMIFLLLVMVVYLLFTQQDTGEKEQDLAANRRNAGRNGYRKRT